MERVAVDDRHFADFVRVHTSSLLSTAYLLTGTRSGAEELVQETFVHLYPKWDKVAGADLPVAYVRRSLANTFVNQKRKASSREVVLEIVPDRWDGHDDVNLLVERDAMWALLATLPERQRTALVLRYYHDLPDEEIAAALSCRAGTVRSLMSRGLAALREQPAAAALPARQRRLP